MPLGGQYRVCFYDDYYDRADTATGHWQPEVRQRDTCWPNATSVATAQSWTPTATSPKKTFTVTLPKAGLGMAPVDPFVEGTYEIGKPITIVGLEGTRPTNATFSYQWFSRADGQPIAPIAGATGKTFTPTAAHNGRWIYAEVTASRPGYKSAKLNTPYTKAGGTHVQITSPLKIAGTAAAGNTLTASYGKPGNTYGEIAWFVDGVPQPQIPTHDQASSQFPVTAAHAGTRIEARVSIYATDGAGNYVDGSNSYHRAQVQVAGQRPAQVLPAAAAPKGTATVGRVLSAPTNVTPDSTATLSYQWLRNSTAISGATASRYTLTKADIGKRVKVRVSVKRPGWWNTYVTTSKATVAKGAITRGKVTVKGKALVGRKLTASSKGWGLKPVKIRHQWLRNGKKIKGATKSTYKVKKADRRKKISVKVTVSKAKYVSVTKKSKSVKIKR